MRAPTPTAVSATLLINGAPGVSKGPNDRTVDDVLTNGVTASRSPRQLVRQVGTPISEGVHADGPKYTEPPTPVPRCRPLVLAWKSAVLSTGGDVSLAYHRRDEPKNPRYRLLGSMDPAAAPSAPGAAEPYRPNDKSPSAVHAPGASSVSRVVGRPEPLLAACFFREMLPPAGSHSSLVFRRRKRK